MTTFYGSKPPGRLRTKDPQHMFAVRYADGQSAYIRVDPKAADYGTAPVLGIAKARQATGEIPQGEIVSVQRVK
jgi:hypothetical protein